MKSTKENAKKELKMKRLPRIFYEKAPSKKERQYGDIFKALPSYRGRDTYYVDENLEFSHMEGLKYHDYYGYLPPKIISIGLESGFSFKDLIRIYASISNNDFAIIYPLEFQKDLKRDMYEDLKQVNGIHIHSWVDVSQDHDEEYYKNLVLRDPYEEYGLKEDPYSELFKYDIERGITKPVKKGTRQSKKTVAGTTVKTLTASQLINRKVPAEKATQFKEGDKKKGMDGREYTIKEYTDGRKRWVLVK